MNIYLRSCLTAGVATITAAAVAFGPTVQEPRHIAPPPSVVQVVSQPVQLSAAMQPTAPVQPLAVTDLPNLLVGWLQRIIVPPSATQPFPTPPSAPGPVPSSIPSTLEWAYHAVEPWVRYGFELATYAAGWVPYVGWLSGQIMIFYNFGESITHAIVHNTLDWLNGQGSFLFNLGEGVAWSINALIQLGIAEWNFFLPPLPPLPPFPLAAQVQTQTQATTTTEALTTTSANTTQVSKKHSAVKGEDAEGPATETAAEATGDSTGKATKAPKAPKEPESATEATTQTPSDSTAESTGTPKATDKKSDNGPKAGTESSPSAKDKGDTKKSDDNGSKKGDKE